MGTVQSVIDELKARASEKTKATYVRHGMPADRVIGVSSADLKLIAKTIKGQQVLALDLYATGYMDAMYLAGMVANGAKMTRDDLSAWVRGAVGMTMIADYTIPWVTIEHPESRALAIEWIGSEDQFVASSGWCTYSGLVTVTPDDALDLGEIETLLGKVAKEIHTERNRVKSTMIGFVIAVGTYVKPLHATAKATAEQIGVVTVDVGDTACKTPLASAYIEKAESANKIGQKRKTIRC